MCVGEREIGGRGVWRVHKVISLMHATALLNRPSL